MLHVCLTFFLFSMAQAHFNSEAKSLHDRHHHKRPHSSPRHPKHAPSSSSELEAKDQPRSLQLSQVARMKMLLIMTEREFTTTTGYRSHREQLIKMLTSAPSSDPSLLPSFLLSAVSSAALLINKNSDSYFYSANAHRRHKTRRSRPHRHKDVSPTGGDQIQKDYWTLLHHVIHKRTTLVTEECGPLTSQRCTGVRRRRCTTMCVDERRYTTVCKVKINGNWMCGERHRIPSRRRRNQL